MTSVRSDTARPAAGALLLTAAGGALLAAIGLPAAWLVAGLVAGIAAALVHGRAVELPAAVTVASEAVIGVALGALLDPAALAPLGDAWPAVALVVAATLGLSVAAGVVLGRRTGLDRPTAALGMSAGGAPGIVAASRDLGADSRLVALMQFVRVALVVATAPPLALLLDSGGRAGGGPSGLLGEHSATAGAVLAALGCAAIGLFAARYLRLPAGSLLLPLAASAAFTLAGGSVAFPVPVTAVALAGLGMALGLRFDRATLASARRVMAATLAGVVFVLAGCAGLAVVLGVAAGLDPLTAYLATTPGGFSTVLAAASDTSAQITVVLGVQTLRLLLIVVAAPLLVRPLARAP